MRHKSRGGALKHLACLKEPGMRAYKCACGFWHIGHTNRMDGIQSRLDRLIGPDPKSFPNNGKPLPTTANNGKLPS